jgi:hypothetical protein
MSTYCGSGANGRNGSAFGKLSVLASLDTRAGSSKPTI